MTAESAKYTLDTLKKYKQALTDILNKQNLQQHLKALEEDISFLNRQPDKENYDVIRNFLFFLIFQIKEKI